MILTLKLILTQKTRRCSANAPLTDSLHFYRKDYALPVIAVSANQRMAELDDMDEEGDMLDGLGDDGGSDGNESVEKDD